MKILAAVSEMEIPDKLFKTGRRIRDNLVWNEDENAPVYIELAHLGEYITDIQNEITKINPPNRKVPLSYQQRSNFREYQKIVKTFQAYFDWMTANEVQVILFH